MAADLEMNMLTLEELDSQNQDTKLQPVPLTAADRRLLLGGAIRLLRSRYATGGRILTEDLVRLTAFADDAAERAA